MPRIFASFLVTAILAGSASAGEITDKAAQAESLAASGKSVEAIEALDQATTSLWDKLPLSFRKVLWIAETARSFGGYTPRQTNVYKAGDEMIVYAEPVGFSWRKVGDMWQSDLAADLTLKTRDGKPVHFQKDLGKGGMSSRARNREYNIRLTVTMADIPAGEYVAEFAVRDAVSGKSGTFSLPFVITSKRS
jgi:hypothetical protein